MKTPAILNSRQCLIAHPSYVLRACYAAHTCAIPCSICSVNEAEEYCQAVVFSVRTIPCRAPAAFCNDVLVGAIAVRLERQPSGKVQLYIITLGVLAAYRDYGVGEHPPSIICQEPPWDL